MDSNDYKKLDNCGNAWRLTFNKNWNIQLGFKAEMSVNAFLACAATAQAASWRLFGVTPPLN